MRICHQILLKGSSLCVQSSLELRYYKYLKKLISNILKLNVLKIKGYLVEIIKQLRSLNSNSFRIIMLYSFKSTGHASINYQNNPLLIDGSTLLIDQLSFDFFVWDVDLIIDFREAFFPVCVTILSESMLIFFCKFLNFVIYLFLLFPQNRLTYV